MSKGKEKHEQKRVEIPKETDLNGDSKLFQLETALSSFANYRFNSITRFPEIQYQGCDKEWKKLEDYKLHSIVRRLKNTGTTHASKTKVGELLESYLSETWTSLRASPPAR